MQWFEHLKAAEEADAAKDFPKAEAHFLESVEKAQSQFGPYNVNVAKCLLAFAQHLEGQERFEDALLRYKLSAAIYRQVGHTGAHMLASGKISLMETLAAQQRKSWRQTGGLKKPPGSWRSS